MKIGVDAASLSQRGFERGGVFQVNYNLLKVLGELDRANKYLLYSFSPIPKKIAEEFGPRMKNIVLRPKRFWLSLRLSLEFAAHQPDVFLGLGQSLPLFHPSKNIIFVYDLAFETYPNCYPNSGKRLSLQTKFAAKHASKIVTISYSTKKDLLNLYGIREGRIKVIYPAADSSFKPQPSRKIVEIRKKYGLVKPFFLFIGFPKPIKNIPKIIEGFSKFSQKQGEYLLALGGGDFLKDPQICRKIQRGKIQKRIKLLGYLSQEDLPAVYSAAKAFVSPSLYEGFGLPLLESIACGTPVISSNIGSAPEAVGKAGILVDPTDSGEIGKSMEKIAQDSRVFNKLKRACPAQAKKFSWVKSGEELLELIQEK